MKKNQESIIDKEIMKKTDSHWSEVMKLAEKYGFIAQAYAGTATLATHEVLLDALGEEEHLKRLRGRDQVHLVTKSETNMQKDEIEMEE